MKLSNTLVSFANFSMLSAMLLFSTTAHSWDLEPTDETSSVKVWTQAVEGSKFRAFKGEVTINVSLTKVLDVITDTEQYPEWYHNNKYAKKLEKLNEMQSLSYAVTKAPWPVTNRDSVTLSTRKPQANGDYIIDLQSRPDAYPKQEGLIRVPQMQGYWKLEKLSEQATKVTLQITADPGGDIPSWLANATVVDMPFYTLNNLKRRLEQ